MASPNQPDEWAAFLRAFDAPTPSGPPGALAGKDDAILELARALTPRSVPGFWPHTPHPPQQAFLLLDDMEAFYGGAAGGGKSDALLMAASQYVDFPQYRGLIIRRTYPELNMPGAIMDRAKSWWAGGPARWVADDHAMVFPSGASITFAHLQHEDDKYRFGSTEFHFIAFDELTRFTEKTYTFMFSRLRKLEEDPIPIRMRSASNPGDLGHEWVRKRFVEPGDAARPFIPARLQDNPSVNRDAYLAALSNLDPVTLKRLLSGDWSVSGEGGFFQRVWFPIVPAVAGSLRRVVRYWDLAASVPTANYPDPDWTRGAKLAVTYPDELNERGVYYAMNMQSIRAEAGTRDALIRQTAVLDGRKVPILFEQEPGSAGKAQIAYFQKMLPGFRVIGIPSTGDKSVRAGPLASQAQAQNVKLVEGPWVEDFLNEADTFPNGGHDDCIDAFAGAFDALTSTPSSKIVSW